MLKSTRVEIFVHKYHNPFVECPDQQAATSHWHMGVAQQNSLTFTVEHVCRLFVKRKDTYTHWRTTLCPICQIKKGIFSCWKTILANEHIVKSVYGISILDFFSIIKGQLTGWEGLDWWLEMVQESGSRKDMDPIQMLNQIEIFNSCSCLHHWFLLSQGKLFFCIYSYLNDSIKCDHYTCRGSP